MAIGAETLDQILALQRVIPNHLRTADLLQPGFFLRQFTEVFLDMFRHIAEFLRRYDEDRTQRAALQDSLTLLQESRSRLPEVGLLESSMLGRVIDQWHQVIKDVFEKPHPIGNPYVAGPPLAPNSPVFIGRGDIFEWIESNLSQTQMNVLVLHGIWRTGKTSILKQLEGGPLGQRLRERSRHPLYPVLVDLTAFLDFGTGAFLSWLAGVIAARLRKWQIPIARPNARHFTRSNTRAFEQFLEEVGTRLEERGDGVLVIMLDEFEKLNEYVGEQKVDARIFSYFRSLMQHQPRVAFILAGRHQLDEMPHEYKNILFNVAQHREVGFLTQTEADRLINEPVEPYGVAFNEEVVKRIHMLTGGHPFLTQQLCHDCVDLLNEQLRKQQGGYRITESHLDCAVEQFLGKGASATLDQLWRDPEIGEGGRQVLSSLSRLAADDGIVVKKDDLQNSLSLLGLDPAKLDVVLGQLQAHRLVVAMRDSDSGETNYRFSFDLFRLWVSRRRV
jgi:hypothetical protein